MIRGDYLGRRADRIRWVRGRPARCERDARRPVRFVEHHVRERDGQVADGRTVNHVAIIDNRLNSMFEGVGHGPECCSRSRRCG